MDLAESLYADNRALLITSSMLMRTQGNLCIKVALRGLLLFAL